MSETALSDAWNFRNADFVPCFKPQWSHILIGLRKQVFKYEHTQYNPANCHDIRLITHWQTFMSLEFPYIN